MGDHVTASLGSFAWATDVLQSDLKKINNFGIILDLQNYYEDSTRIPIYLTSSLLYY